MNKQLSRAIMGGAAILVIAWIVGQLWGTRFDAYSVAVAAVSSDEAVAKHIGANVSVRLAMLDGYHVSTAGTDSDAEYRLIVKGEANSGMADVVLSRRVGRWSLVEGNLTLDSGAVFPLEPRAITLLSGP
jgi:hypothetical protein